MLKKILKNLYEVVITILIFGIVPAICFVLITSRTSAILGIRTFNVLTGSMEPQIPTGAMVFSMYATRYSVGDIITYNKGDITVTHRIVGVKNGEFVTKGDANQISDPWLVNQNQVIGRDFFILPLLGKFTSFIKTLPGFLLLIAVPTIIFVGFEIWEIKEEYRKEVEKKLMEKLNMT